MHVFIECFKSFVGFIEVTANDVEILKIDFVSDFRKSRPNFITALAREWFDIYFSGKDPDFSLPLAERETEFSRIVTEEVKKIPFSKCESYGEIAAKIDRPKAYRAVAQVMRSNPFIIVVPCHRVVAKNGIGGYSAGQEIKKELLEFEKCESINL